MRYVLVIASAIFLFPFLIYAQPPADHSPLNYYESQEISQAREIEDQTFTMAIETIKGVTVRYVESGLFNSDLYEPATIAYQINAHAERELRKLFLSRQLDWKNLDEKEIDDFIVETVVELFIDFVPITETNERFYYQNNGSSPTYSELQRDRIKKRTLLRSAREELARMARRALRQARSAPAQSINHCFPLYIGSPEYALAFRDRYFNLPRVRQAILKHVDIGFDFTLSLYPGVRVEKPSIGLMNHQSIFGTYWSEDYFFTQTPKDLYFGMVIKRLGLNDFLWVRPKYLREKRDIEKIKQNGGTNEIGYGENAISENIPCCTADEFELEFGLSSTRSFYSERYNRCVCSTDSVLDSAFTKPNIRFASTLNGVHEMTHAIQRQSRPYAKIYSYPNVDEDPNEDQTRAEASVIEGEAFLAEDRYLEKFSEEQLKTLNVDKEGKTIFKDSSHYTDIYRPMKSEGPQPSPTDALVRLEDFPYITGAQFIKQLAKRRGERPTKTAEYLFNHPPTSSEQVIHVEKYLSSEQPQEIPLRELDPISNALKQKEWELIDNNVGGEVHIRALFDSWKVALEESKASSAGWGGDRYYVFRKQGTEDSLLIWIIKWDSKEDLDEFKRTYQTALERRTQGDERKKLMGLTKQIESGDTIGIIEGNLTQEELGQISDQLTGIVQQIGERH